MSHWGTKGLASIRIVRHDCENKTTLSRLWSSDVERMKPAVREGFSFYGWNFMGLLEFDWHSDDGLGSDGWGSGIVPEDAGAWI